MAKTIRLHAGEKTTIFSRSFSSMPMEYHFQATALDGGTLDGDIEIRGSSWIFRKPPATLRLHADNVVQAGFWDTFFSVSVIARSNIEVTLPTRSLHASLWILGLAALVIIIVALSVFLLAR